MVTILLACSDFEWPWEGDGDKPEETGDTGDGGPDDSDDSRDSRDSRDSDESGHSGQDSDSGETTEDFCSQRLDSSAPAGPECLSEVLGCGDVIEATNDGGFNDYEGDDYTHNFCFPNLSNHDYDAPERVYALYVEAGVQASITLSTPCGDLDLAVARWWDAESCPTADDSYSVCEGDDDDGGASTSVDWDVETWWLLMVDGKYDSDVYNFRLSVQCD